MDSLFSNDFMQEPGSLESGNEYKQLLERVGVILSEALDPTTTARGRQSALEGLNDIEDSAKEKNLPEIVGKVESARREINNSRLPTGDVVVGVKTKTEASREEQGGVREIVAGEYEGVTDTEYRAIRNRLNKIGFSIPEGRTVGEVVANGYLISYQLVGETLITKVGIDPAVDSLSPEVIQQFEEGLAGVQASIKDTILNTESTAVPAGQEGTPESEAIPTVEEEIREREDRVMLRAWLQKMTSALDESAPEMDLQRYLAKYDEHYTRLEQRNDPFDRALIAIVADPIIQRAVERLSDAGLERLDETAREQAIEDRSRVAESDEELESAIGRKDLFAKQFAVSREHLERQVPEFEALSHAQQELVFQRLSDQVLARIHRESLQKYGDENPPNLEKGFWAGIMSIPGNLKREVMKDATIAQYRHEKMEDIRARGIDSLGEDVRALCIDIAPQKVIERDGNPLIAYLDVEEISKRSIHQEVTEEHKRVIDRYNDVANEMRRIPQKWSSLDTASAKENVLYTDVEARLDAVRREVAECLPEYIGKGGAAYALLDTAKGIQMEQWSIENPQASSILQDVAKEPWYKSRIAAELGFKGLKMGVYGGLGFFRREGSALASAASASAGIGGFSALAFAAAPSVVLASLTGGLMGSFRARREVQSAIDTVQAGGKDERGLAASMREASRSEMYVPKKSETGNEFKKLVGLTDKLDERIDRVEQLVNGEVSYKLQRNLELRALHLFRSGVASAIVARQDNIPGEELQKETERVLETKLGGQYALSEVGLRMREPLDADGNEPYKDEWKTYLYQAQHEELTRLRARIAATEMTIKKNRVSFGTAPGEALDQQTRLLESLSKAKTLLVIHEDRLQAADAIRAKEDRLRTYKGNAGREEGAGARWGTLHVVKDRQTTEQRLDRFIESQEKGLDANRKRFVRNQIIKGAVISGTFATAMASARTFFGWFTDSPEAQRPIDTNIGKAEAVTSAASVGVEQEVGVQSMYEYILRSIAEIPPETFSNDPQMQAAFMYIDQNPGLVDPVIKIVTGYVTDNPEAFGVDGIDFNNIPGGTKIDLVKMYEQNPAQFRSVIVGAFDRLSDANYIDAEDVTNLRQMVTGNAGGSAVEIESTVTSPAEESDNSAAEKPATEYSATVDESASTLAPNESIEPLSIEISEESAEGRLKALHDLGQQVDLTYGEFTEAIANSFNGQSIEDAQWMTKGGEFVYVPESTDGTPAHFEYSDHPQYVGESTETGEQRGVGFNVDSRYYGQVDKAGEGLWSVATKVKDQLNMSDTEFNRAWANSTYNAEGTEHHISSMGLVHKGDYLRYIMGDEANGIKPHFEIIDAKGGGSIGTDEALKDAFEKAGKPLPDDLKERLGIKTNDLESTVPVDKPVLLSGFGHWDAYPQTCEEWSEEVSGHTAEDLLSIHDRISIDKHGFVSTSGLNFDYLPGDEIPNQWLACDDSISVDGPHDLARLPGIIGGDLELRSQESLADLFGKWVSGNLDLRGVGGISSLPEIDVRGWVILDNENPNLIYNALGQGYDVRVYDKHGEITDIFTRLFKEVFTTELLTKLESLDINPSTWLMLKDVPLTDVSHPGISFEERDGNIVGYQILFDSPLGSAAQEQVRYWKETGSSNGITSLLNTIHHHIEGGITDKTSPEDYPPGALMSMNEFMQRLIANPNYIVEGLRDITEK